MRATNSPSLTRVAALAGSLALAGNLAVVATPVHAQNEPGLSGEVEVGGQAITGDNWENSRFQKYDATTPGVFGSATLSDEDERFFFEFRARDIAEDDQSYSVRTGRFNRYRLEVEYDEFPQIYGSGQSLTLHAPEGKGVLLLPDTLQTSIEPLAGAARATALQDAYRSAFPVHLRSDIRNARAGFFFRATPEVEFDVGYRLTQNKGTRPWGMGFGSPGGTFVNVAAPIDQITHEVSAGLGYTRGDVALRFEYVASLFDNDVDTLTVDNPVAGPPDAVSGPSQGRADLAPDNSAHTFTLSGTSALPAGFPLRLTGTLAYSFRRQDDAFVPHTINSAILATDPNAGLLALPADSLDGKVSTYLAMLKLAGRPAQRLNTSVFYRFYMYDNETDELVFPGHVVNDFGAVVDDPRPTTRFDYHKQNAGVDFSYDVSRPLSTRLGFEWERWDRSSHREVQVSDEYIARLGATYRAARWAQVRADARAGFRIGEGYDPFAHLAHVVPEPDLASAIPQSQSPLLRKYDEANRRLYRGDLGLRLLPGETVTVNLTGGASFADYYDSDLGLRDTWAWNAGTDVSYQPVGWLQLSAFYTFEYMSSDQRSRWRPRTFVAPITVTDDPINNWASDTTDHVHTVGTSADVVLIDNVLDFSAAYVLEHARVKTRSSSTPGTSNPAADGGNAPDWPTEKDWLHSLVAALRYHVVQNLTVKAEYRLELYNLTSFRWDGLDPVEPDSSINGSGGGLGVSSDVFLPYLGQDYSANVFALSLIYRF